ncbi:hypothetical protein EVJ58_g5618 [Rhodofomes roseus]|uniref:Cytochrome P450 n=1 Tax=Rhodofomes roseus TaxID=34475 RepID=A0A4Y9YC07_9APHY|nr:hypothetical protein EVJ58_g5618 [Rhodofomes roseus]
MTGPIYSLRILGSSMLVLNSASEARDLIEGKSSLYAPRPPPKMVELAGMDRGVLFESNPVRMRKSRKLLHMVLQPRELRLFDPTLVEKNSRFLHNLLQNPHKFLEHIRKLPAGVTLALSHGYEVQEEDDPYVAMADVTVQNFAKASDPAAFLVHWLPILAKLPTFLPGMQFKRLALSWRQQYTALAERGHEHVESNIVRKVWPSLTSLALASELKDERDIIMFTATQVYTGEQLYWSVLPDVADAERQPRGSRYSEFSDLRHLSAKNPVYSRQSTATLSSFFLMMMKHPDVQRRAQQEIDQVIGDERLPVYGDRPQLPYVESLLKELLRCCPPIPAVTRAPAQDDVHKGYYIPKGTVVVVNFWAMLHDKTRYDEPDQFRPDRWLSRDADVNTDPFEVIFGFGRRTCPGRHLAESLLFTAIATTLAAFDIAVPRDEQGNLVEPTGEYSDGGIMLVYYHAC